MRSIAIALFILASLSTSASTIIISPYNPADCKTKNFEKVNWISLVEKSFEDDNIAEFTFNTQYGSCIDQKFITRDILISRLTLTLFQDGFNIPFAKRPVTISTEHYGSKQEARVVLTFNKNIAFKKKNTRNFIMEFNPSSGFQFPWKLKISNDINNEVNLSFAK